MKLKVNDRKKKKYWEMKTMWKASITILNNQQVKGEVIKYFQMKENEFMGGRKSSA